MDEAVPRNSGTLSASITVWRGMSFRQQAPVTRGLFCVPETGPSDEIAKAPSGDGRGLRMVRRFDLEDEYEQNHHEDDRQKSTTAPGGRVALFLLADAAGDVERVLNSGHMGSPSLLQL